MVYGIFRDPDKKFKNLEEIVVNSEVVINNREPLQIFTDKKNKVDTSA